MESTPVSLFGGQNYFQLLVTGGIYINPRLLQFVFGTISCTGWPHKIPKVPWNKKTLTHHFPSPPPHPLSQTVSLCCDWEQVGSLSTIQVHELHYMLLLPVVCSVKVLTPSLIDWSLHWNHTSQLLKYFLQPAESFAACETCSSAHETSEV